MDWNGFENYRVIHRMAAPWPPDVLIPFAFDELYARQVGEGAPCAIHLWRHPSALVLGLRDRKLPAATQAIQYFRDRGMDVAVRHSGGAVVPLDPGIVNLSLILRKDKGKIELNADFERMAQLIAASIEREGFRVKAGEIVGAYCPGDYDLSVNGRKFCGIAQRRQTKAYVIQAFVNVEGSGADRAAIAQTYYRLADVTPSADTDKGKSGRTPWASAAPIVTPQQTASLAELGGPASALDFATDVLGAVEQLAGPPLETVKHYPIAEYELKAMADSLRERYDRD